MGVGILQTHQHAPGTVRLIDDRAEDDVKDTVLLVPRPSKSPNDPLNWPIWKKDLALFSIAYGAALAGIQGGSLSVVTAELAVEFNVPLTKAETSNTYWFLATAVACLLSSISARLFGKRLIYTVAISILFTSAAWNAAAKTFSSLLASRIVYGLGLGAFESLPWSSIGDLYFVHERGRRVAAYTFFSLGGYNLSPVLSGFLAETYGWRISLWILVAFYGVALLLVVFALPETSYVRPLQYETDVVSEEADTTDAFQTEKEVTAGVDVEVASEEEERPRSYLKQLIPYKNLHAGNPLRLIIRYFSCTMYPIVWFTFLIPSIYLGWTIALSTTMAQIFSFPPISFSLTQMGFLSTFCCPGALVAFIFTHILSDRLAIRLAKKNGNVYEPEFRLVLILPALLLSPLAFGLFGWYNGTVAETSQISWVVSSFIYGLIILCVVNVNIVAFAYLLDAHREISTEACVFAIMLRNLFAYGVSTFIAPWLASQGIAKTFYEIAGISTGVLLLLTSFFYIFGKRMRGFVHAHVPMLALPVRVENL
ncbi:MAG: hypothetical protein M1818_002856 [Claussenomyces sp. TS43310]|nr:MAG: hypothetical protein M1818_002856 [Claussenomyces sp. TS43310]